MSSFISMNIKVKWPIEGYSIIQYYEHSGLLKRSFRSQRYGVRFCVVPIPLNNAVSAVEVVKKSLLMR